MRKALASLLAVAAMLVALGWSSAPASASSYTAGRFALELDG